MHAGPSQYDDDDDEEEDREVGAIFVISVDHDDRDDHDDIEKEEEVVVRGSLAKEELEQHYSVYWPAKHRPLWKSRNKQNTSS